jgi:hypothetical protein
MYQLHITIIKTKCVIAPFNLWFVATERRPESGNTSAFCKADSGSNLDLAIYYSDSGSSRGFHVISGISRNNWAHLLSQKYFMIEEVQYKIYHILMPASLLHDIEKCQKWDIRDGVEVV